MITGIILPEGKMLRFLSCHEKEMFPAVFNR